jgi:hypothetical protein
MGCDGDDAIALGMPEGDGFVANGSEQDASTAESGKESSASTSTISSLEENTSGAIAVSPVELSRRAREVSGHDPSKQAA